MDSIREVLETVDREITAEVMSELLMDDNWSTWKMFEGLASDYLNGSADVRKGIDLACSALTGWYLSSIADQILERAAEYSEEDDI
jgi:hypothetical protein